MSQQCSHNPTQEEEEYGRAHHMIEELEGGGINAQLIKRLKENGFHTVEAVSLISEQRCRCFWRDGPALTSFGVWRAICSSPRLPLSLSHTGGLHYQEDTDCHQGSLRHEGREAAG